jgi:hypothetical protein
MSVTHLFRFSLVAAVAIGCSSDPTSPQLRALVYSAAARGCGPTNEPAVVVILAPNPVIHIDLSAPYVNVLIPVGKSELTANVWRIGSNTEAGAGYLPFASTVMIAGSGSVTVSSVDGSNVHGSLDLSFPNAGRIKSDFHAKWLTESFYCISGVVAPAP